MSRSSRTKPSAAPSGAFADLPAGTVLAGFRVESLIGRGSRATVYEATQLSLDRRVALKLLHDPELSERVRRLRWPEHPGAVSLFGSGDSEHGPWLAMRLVRGGTLETHDAPLERVSAALAQAHAAGIVHGDVRARNVLVERGRAHLSDFGLADGSLEEDRAALAGLVLRHDARRAGRRRRRAAALAAIVAVAGVAAVTVVIGGDDVPSASPAGPEGTRPVGSALARGDVESVDCGGGTPGGASRACTISQRDLAGAAVVVPVDGTITSWAVRGARGTLALQVLRGRGRLVEVARSADEVVPDDDLHLARTRIAVAAGDRVALLVTPGAAIGVRRASARTERWFGPLVEPPRPPERGAGTGLDRELLLRADVRPGAAVPAITALRGAPAAAAPDGRRVAARGLTTASGAEREVHLVVVGGEVALDLYDGARRLARAPLPDASALGRLQMITAGRGTVRVKWRNADGVLVERRFGVTDEGISPPRRSG